jgi:Arc/MetJ-type ribon-helix-helix transcriptional regulator
MPSSITLSLSPVLSQWVDSQSARRGFGTANDFVHDLIRRAHEKELSQQEGQHLTQAMQTLVAGMSERNWADVRKAGRTRAREHHPIQANS